MFLSGEKYKAFDFISRFCSKTAHYMFGSFGMCNIVSGISCKSAEHPVHNAKLYKSTLKVVVLHYTEAEVEEGIMERGDGKSGTSKRQIFPSEWYLIILISISKTRFKC